MKAVIYARYSSDSQREESIEGQLRECTAFAEKNGITVLRHYIDRAYSAKTDNRPEFQNMIKDSGKRLFDIVIVWKLDRFARNRYDSARYKATLKKNGVKVVSATEIISEGAEGIILESVLEGYAEYYSADLSEKVVRGMTDNALKCKFNGGMMPIGYVIDAEQHFKIDPLTAPFVLEAFKRYDGGETISSIMNWLNEQGLTNTRGRKMTFNSVGHILHNRRYIGEFRYRDVIVPDGIPAIVPQDLFDRVQEKLAKNKKAPARHKAEDDYLLTTKLFCGYCGAYLCGESGTSRTGKVHHYYKCVSVKKKRTECHKKPVRKEWIEDLVVGETMKMVMDDKAIEAIVSMLMDLQDRDNVNVPLYEQQLREAETAISNLLNAIQQGILTRSTKERLEELENRRDELENRLACEKLAKPKVSAEFMTFWLHRFRKLDVRQQSHRKILIDTFINAIFLYDDKMVITFNYKEGTKTITFAELQEAISNKNGSDLDCLAAPKIRPSAKGRWSYFWVPLPVVAQPQGDRTCPEQVNCPCARILLRKILVTAHPRRLAVWEHGSVGVHTAASWPDGTGLTLALPHYSNILRFCYRCPKPLYFAKNWGILASGRRGDRMEDYTRKFNAAKEKDEEIHHILTSVYTALEEKGYNPINQLVGYILSEDPTYITNHRQARTLIRKLDRDELLQVLLRSYLSQ